MEDIVVILIITFVFLALFVLLGLLSKKKSFKNKFGRLSSIIERINDAIGSVFQNFFP